MNLELEVIHEKLATASAPEDVFGMFPGLSGSELKNKITTIYRRLAKACHPDAHPHDTDDAHKLFARLNTLNTAALAKVENHTYGDRAPMHGSNHTGTYDPPIVVKGVYRLYRSYAIGDIADLHACYVQERGKKIEYIFKTARKAADNPLLDHERSSLELLKKKLRNDWLACIPKLKESFLLDEGDRSNKRRVNILEPFAGFCDGVAIHKAYPYGVDGRTIAWMWKRLLGLLEYVHGIGLIHGAVLPPHVMYYPDNDGGSGNDKRKHSVRLIDWCYSTKNEPAFAKLIAWCPQYKSLYPPEVFAKKNIGPWTDLYMGAKTMLYLLGGDTETNQFPAHVPVEMAASFKKWLHPDPLRRPADPRRYFDEFVQLLQQLYGPPKYHQFIMPR